MWTFNFVLLGLIYIWICGVAANNMRTRIDYVFVFIILEIYEKLNSEDISKEEVKELLLKLDQENSFEALKFSGNIYFFGNKFVNPNYEKALSSFEMAYKIDQSDSDVLFMIGLMYNYGVGCDLDSAKGLIFMVASARLGNDKANAALGHAQYFGHGLEKNCPSSRVYLYRAAKKCLKEMSPKDALSIRKPARLSTKATDSDKAKSQQEALDYYEYSAKSGDGTASILLAQLYYFGTEGSDPDYEKARINFENAIAFGHESSYAFLGQIYYHGEGVPVDYQKAFEYFSKAAERNVASALNGLGLMYWHGQVVEKDLDIAESYFKQAADLKYPEAFYNYAMVLLDQPALFKTEKIFQNLLAATKLGYVFANVEIVKRYLKSENSCSTSITFLKQILDKGPSLKLFKEAHQYYLRGFEDQALSRYIYLAAQGFEVANFNSGFILEQSKDPKYLQRAAFFYSRSAQMENSEARKKVGDAYSKLGDNISAVAHYVIAAKSDNPDPEALFNLGYAYETGIGLKKDLWSALDMYTASLSYGKSGKIAVSLALAKVKVKLFIEELKNPRVPKMKNRKSSFKSRKESDKILSMLATLILTGIIYWYMNYFQPRQDRLRNAARQNNAVENQLRQNNSSSPELKTEKTVTSPSVHSDSSSEKLNVELTEFRFRRSPKNNSQEVIDEKETVDEVD